MTVENRFAYLLPESCPAQGGDMLKLSTFMKPKQGKHSKRLSFFAVCTVIFARNVIVISVKI